jgi:hypothetical protein
MTAVCDSLIHLCFVRVTRLDSLGNPVPGPNNVVVSDKPMVLTITPDVLAGEVKDGKSGCDALLYTYRGQDIVKRYNLELDIGVDQVALDEILTGGTAITDTGGAPIGLQFQAPCDFQSPFVAFEAWQDNWRCDHQPGLPYPYTRWLFPASRWIHGAVTLQNDVTIPKYTGFTLANDNWGLGIYGDQPVAALPNGMRFKDFVLPTAACSWQSHALT